jgi:hypothetical protein
MHETDHQDRIAKTQWKAPHYGAGAGILILGLIAGRAFFPLEIPRPFVVEKEKRVEVPVERIVYRDRIIERAVSSVPAGLSAWLRITNGLSRDQVREILGEPRKIEGGTFEKWIYGVPYPSSAVVVFWGAGVYSWTEP